MHCTRCEGTGFLNIHQTPDEVSEGGIEVVLKWTEETDLDHDVVICDCCGDGEGWYGTPGEHYGSDDPQGHNGPYAYNGGLCECH